MESPLDLMDGLGELIRVFGGLAAQGAYFNIYVLLCP